MKKMSALASMIAALGLTSAASAQFLLVPNQTTDSIMQFHPFDGTLLNADFIINGAGVGYEFATPKEAIQVGSEIWVCDQLTDQIARFDMAGVHLGTIATGLDNARGLAYANGVVYVSNSGSNNGAPGDALVMFGPDGSFIGNILDVGDPFDVYEHNGELLIADIGAEAIRRHAYDGTFLGVLHDSDGITGIDFPQQINPLGTNVMVAGFSSPAGIYEYDPTGAQVNYFDVGAGLRGAYELGNGNIMWTSSGGTHILDRVSGVSTMIISGSGQYINLISGEDEGCLADYNGDDEVNSNDISAFLTAWLDSVQNGNLIADFNIDGAVNSNDISAFLTAWLDALQNGC